MATVAPTAPGYAGMRAVDVIIEWLSTTDHKKIGLLYIFTALGFALVGGAFSLVMRTELAQTRDHHRRRNVQPALHDARQHHAVPIHPARRRGLHELHRAPANRCARHGVPADERAVLLDVRLWRDHDGQLLRVFRRQRPRPAGLRTRPWRANTGANAQPLGAGDGFSGSSASWSSEPRQLPGAINFLTTIFKLRAPRNDDVPAAAVHVDDARHLVPGPPRDAGAGLGADHAVRGPQRRGVAPSSTQQAKEDRCCCGRTSSGSTRIQRSTS